MSSGITLSAGVRANLLSLQNTAQLMQTTQNRLATGKKVNSALDNPLSFFTSQSLGSRASDLSALLDSMSNGIQTIQAANNGLTSITSTVQSMQSTLNQALQDKSFQTSSYTLGTATTGNISFTGGALGTTAVSVNLMTGGTAGTPTNAVATGATALSAINVGPAAATSGSFTSAAFGDPATSASITAGAFSTTNISGGSDSIAFTVNVDSTDHAISIDSAAVTAYNVANSTSLDDAALSAQDLADIINYQVDNTGATTIATVSSGALKFTSTTTGASSSVTISGTAETATGGASGVADATIVNGTDAVTTLDLNGSSVAFTLNVDGTDHAISVDAAAVTAYNTANSTTLDESALSATDLANIINYQVDNTGATTVASVPSGALKFTSTTTGADSDVTISGFSAGTTTGTTGIANHAIASGVDKGTSLTFNINNQTVTLAAGGGTGSTGNFTASDIMGAINTQVGTSAKVAATIVGGKLTLTSTGTAGLGDTIKVDAFSSGDATQLGFTGTTASAAGTDATMSGGVQKTVDQLVTDINSTVSLAGKVVASNDSGKLRIQNVSTTALTVGGATAAGINGSSSTTTVAGNDVRKGLVNQFNTLRDQLDKFADDASYNGVNLLHGDNLKLTLNETGTSALNIQAKDANGAVLSINSDSLGIDAAANADFDSDATLNTKLDTLTKSLSTLRSQASSFGSNLSVVQNRQNFTNAMINTLQTGGDNLVLADSNQEGANLLALQTRQSLSTTALSLSAQADQAVLSLFQ